MNRIKFLIVGIILIVFTACGYKPSSTVIKSIFDQDIYVEVNVDSAEPENAPFVKDEMIRLIYTRFKGRVTSDKESKNRIMVNYRGSKFYGVSYDDRGFITRYRANIYVKFKMYTKDGVIKKRISARHEANVPASSLASSKLRTEAIKRGLEKALDEFIAYVSVKGVLKTEEEDNKTVISKVNRDDSL